MALKPLYLADKSALARIVNQTVAKRLHPLMLHGFVATCPIVDLEVLFSARTHADYDAILAERNAMPSFPTTEIVTSRALEVQYQLSKRGQHRLPVADLLIAATAEVNDVAVLHYDADFDRIASVTGQPVEWVVPRGSA